MPEVCRFDGIRVYIYPGDHDPPHFHARRADFRVKVDISSVAVTKGRMPSSVERRLLDWAGEHQAELMEACDESGLGKCRIGLRRRRGSKSSE